MEDIINLLYKNKEWLFSGIGVTAIIFVFSFFKKDKPLNINIYHNQDTSGQNSPYFNENREHLSKRKKLILFLIATLTFISTAISLNPPKEQHIKKLSDLKSFLYLESANVTYKNHFLYSEMILDSNDSNVLTRGFLGKVYELDTLSQFEVFTRIRMYISDIKVQQEMFGFDSLKSFMQSFYLLKSGLDYKNHELIIALSKTLEDTAFILYTSKIINDKNFKKDPYFSKKSSNDRLNTIAKRLSINNLEFQKYTAFWDEITQEQIEKVFIDGESYFSDHAAKDKNTKNANEHVDDGRGDSPRP